MEWARLKPCRRRQRPRDIKVWSASGEKLSFPDRKLGGVLIAVTLCFVDNPVRVLLEVSRVLISNGGLVLGLILKESSWAEFYAKKGKERHPIYSRAQFFSNAKIYDAG